MITPAHIRNALFAVAIVFIYYQFGWAAAVAVALLELSHKDMK